MFNSAQPLSMGWRAPKEEDFIGHTVFIPMIVPGRTAFEANCFRLTDQTNFKLVLQIVLIEAKKHRTGLLPGNNSFS